MVSLNEPQIRYGSVSAIAKIGMDAPMMAIGGLTENQDPTDEIFGFDVRRLSSFCQRSIR
jgi:hypothetical protein